MKFKCNNCNFSSEISTNRVVCICGKEFIYENIVKSKSTNKGYLSCIYRKEMIGKIDCGCQGNNKVYKCELFDMCSIRKLKPGLPIIKLNNDIKITDKEIEYCNLCESREEV